jgi:hypothetical protein
MPRQLKNNGKCKVANCNNDAKAKQMCWKHYIRYRKYKNTELPNPRNVYSDNDTCIINGCTNKIKGLYLCRNHYSNYHYYKKSGRFNNVDEYVEFKNQNQKEGN